MNTNGIINVYKEKGFTSFDVVAKLRGILRMKKIGHTGTLDPDATGVLPVCLGKGTKVVDFLTNKKKTYKAIFKTGFTTDTQDISGTVEETFEGKASLSEMTEALLSFVGDYHQIPPMYSALKVNGQRLYDLARKGITVERKGRDIFIHDIINIEQIDKETFSFEVTCSKGTYIRTLIYDVGNQLGIGATMTELTRTYVEPFTIEKALTLDQIEELMKNGNVNEHIMAIDAIFNTYESLVVSTEYEKILYNGNKLPISLIEELGLPVVLGELFKVYDSHQTFIGLFKVTEKDNIIKLKVEKMFY